MSSGSLCAGLLESPLFALLDPVIPLVFFSKINTHKSIAIEVVMWLGSLPGEPESSPSLHGGDRARRIVLGTILHVAGRVVKLCVEWPHA